MTALRNLTAELHVQHGDSLTLGSNNSANESSFMSADEEPYIYLEHHFGLMIFSALVIGSAAVIGSVGNFLVVLAVCCVRALRTCGNLFVLNLALADMIITLLVAPFNVIGYVAGRSVLIANYNLCNWIASFCGPACMSSMWNMCAISLNRYVLICKPHLYPKIFTFRSTILYCIGIWVLVHLLHMPNHIGWGQNRFSTNYYICTFDTITHSYGIFYIVTGVMIPLMGVLFGYMGIFIKVRKVKHQIRQHRLATKINKSSTIATGSVVPSELANTVQPKKIRLPTPSFDRDDIKLAKTLFTAFLVFLISWFLCVVLVLAHNPAEVPGYFYVMSDILAHGNSAVNPILYGFMNDKFREGYRTILCLSPGGAVSDSSTVSRKKLVSGTTAGSHGVESNALTNEHPKRQVSVIIQKAVAGDLVV